MKKIVINISISVIITLLLVRAMYGVWSSGDVFAGLKSMNPVYFPAAVGCYVMTYPLRAFRIFYMMRKKEGVTFSGILPVCFRHQFYGRIIPFKAGELSLVYLLKKRFGASAAEGGVLLLFLRLFDAAVMVFFFLVCNLFVGAGGWLSYAAAAMLGVILIFAAVSAWFFSGITAFLKKRGNRKAASAADSVLSVLKSVTVCEFFVILLSTAALWVFVYLSMHFVAVAFFSGLSFAGTVAATFLASVAAFLPVNGLGGFGTTEAGWTLGFSLIGMDREAALVSGVVSNLMSFLVVCVFGGISFLKRGDNGVRDYNNKQ